MQNTHRPLREILTLFCSLSPVDTRLPAADYRAEMTGPGWLRWSARPALACIGFNAWYGKRIFSDGRAINLKLKQNKRMECLPMQLSINASRADGEPCWVLRYPESTHFPVRHMVDELRALDDQRLLGISYTELPGVRRMGLPFLLHRQS